MALQRRKTTQFERLITGMVQATNRRGYAGANVSSVIAEAGVSRPTFYDYFVDREDCLRAAIEHVQGQLHTLTSEALTDTVGEAAWQAAIAALVEYATSEPARARFLMGEAMAGGAKALDARDRGIAALAAMLEAAVDAAPATATVADLQPRVALGSVYRMIAARLRRGEVVSTKLTEELWGWLSSYARTARSRRWESLSPLPPPAASPHVPDVPIQRMPSGLGGGRPRLAPEEVAENQRLRILYATAKLAEMKGYASTTVADITKLARVRANTFYRQFADKQEAFAAVHELGFQQVMDVTAKAFFSVEGWPLRSWEAGRAFTQLLQANPLVAHVAFVEAYAVGPGAVQRIEDTHTAFMFFLQEGLTLSEEPVGRVAMEAIIASVFEVIYLQARAGEELQIAGMLPHIAHLWLTPFLGPKASDAFIDAQLRKAKTGAKAQRKPRPAPRGGRAPKRG
jgi:AcrR family transcriptional regulator